MGTANLCNDYKEPQPFSFKGRSLKAQSQELIVNTVWNLRKKLKDDAWLKMSPTEAGATLLNLSRNTIYSILSKYERGEAFSDAKKPCRRRPVTELDEYQQKLLYNIVTGYYKKNTVPRFANVLRDFVEQVRLHQLQQIESQSIPSAAPSGDETTALSANVLTEIELVDEERPSPDIYLCGAWSFSKVSGTYQQKSLWALCYY